MCQSGIYRAIASLSADHKKSWQWLIIHFGIGNNKTDNPLRFVRELTAFHYDKLKMDQAVKHWRSVHRTRFTSHNIR